MTPLLEQLERTMLAVCASSPERSDVCERAVRAHLRAGGSRVRARICLEASIRLGLSAADAVAAGAMCELIHNASLVQDDLLDRTATRRQAPSIWAEYGDAMAVCCGDLMLSAAYSLVGELSAPLKMAPALALVHRRTREAIAGEASQGCERDRAEDPLLYYQRQAKGKSASLLSLALEFPLLLADQAPFLARAHLAASDFAVAYQIYDDIVDFEPDRQGHAANLLLLLMLECRLPMPLALTRALELAAGCLSSAEDHAKALPYDCASALVEQAKKLGNALAEPRLAPLALAAG